MKPNDKAFEAAIAEGKRWHGSNFTGWRVLREDDIQNGWDIVAEFDNREERDEALERLRAEAMVNAAYAPQFPPSEDYAGLGARLRDWGAMNYKICNEAADALEALLAERDALNFELAARKEWPQARAEMLEELAKVRAERDDLLAHLAPVDDRNLEILAAKEWIEATTDMPPRTTYTIFNAVSIAALSERSLAGARAAISAIRPHIEAAERERCAKIAETPDLWVTDKPSRGCDDIAAAIRSGK